MYNSPVPQTRTSSGGFTLIELMIVVTIVAIISAIAYPSYTSYVIRGKRAEGRAFLTDIAARQERFYSNCNQYAANTGTGNNNCGTSTMKAGSTSETGKYTLSIGSLGASNQTFTLTASPTFDDPECGNLTLTQTGQRGISGTGNVNDCWGR